MIIPDGKHPVSKWYFRGIAGLGAACCTHPLDLIKVHIQMEQVNKISMLSHSIKIIEQEGFLALYNGLTGSMLRQVTYSTTRIGIYESGKYYITRNGKKEIKFPQAVFLAGFGGALGGFVGTPGDMVNVRMQYDINLPQEERKNYRHAFHGIYKIYRDEGLRKVFAGGSMATTRAAFVTVGQFSFYDQVKIILMDTGVFMDDSITHFLASMTAGTIATFATTPLDVLKTRLMNAKPGEYRNIRHLIMYTSQLGPLGFLKGFIPAFIRLGPNTVIMFIILEQLRKNVGVLVDD